MGLIGKIWVRLGLDNSELKRGLDESKQQTNAFGNTMRGIGTKIATVFAIDRIIAFGKEMIGLRAKTIGVEAAFKKLNQPTLLNELRTATNNTVSSLELMQQAVMASNFKLPLSELATYLAFATQRAKDTGQSVDYLVQSIITGLGRQSVMILDNLGLSAVEIRKKMESGGTMAEAVGKIIREQMGDANTTLSETVNIIDELSVSWTNLKSTLSLGFVGDVFRGFGLMLKNQMDAISGGNGQATETNFEKANKQQAKAMMSAIKSETDARMALWTLGDKNLSLSEQLFKGYLEEYLAQKKIADLENYRLNNTIAGLEETIELRNTEFKASKDPERRKAIVDEIRFAESRIKLIQGQSGAIENGLIPQMEREIELLKKQANEQSGIKGIRAIKDKIALKEEELRLAQLTTAEIEKEQGLIPIKEKEIKLLQERLAKITDPAILNVQLWLNRALDEELKLLKMTNAERDKYRKDKVESEFPIPELTGFDLQTVFDIEDPNLENITKFVDKLEDETERAKMIANEFGSSVAIGFSDGMKVLMDALVSGEKVDSNAMVAAILEPFAQMSIRIGEMAIANGVAAIALKQLAKVPALSIAAGAALVSLGQLAMAGLGRMVSGGNKGSQQASSTTFTGGASGFNTASQVQAPQLNFVGVLKGSDIYMSVQKESDKRGR